MPYKRFPGLRRIAPLGCAVAALACSAPGAALAAAPPMPVSGTGVLSVDAANCAFQTLTQPFAPTGDSNWYTLLPGEQPGVMTGTGWTLGGGASLTTTTRANGTPGSIVNLPSNGYAVTPPICVTSAYPTARTMVRDVKGSEGVQMYVAYDGTSTWINPRNVGQFHGNGTSWTLSGNMNLQPAGTAGWQVVRFAFVAGGSTSDFQMYDFWVDPRMKL